MAHLGMLLRRPFLVGSALALVAVGASAIDPNRIFADGFESGDTVAWNPPAWLGYVNELRSLGAVPALAENAEWSDGCFQHTRYVIKEQDPGHDQDDGGPWASAAGLAAAINGNQTASGLFTLTDRAMIDSWMVAPFHGIGMVDQELGTTGFGSYRETGIGAFRAAGCLDVIRGLELEAPGAFGPSFYPRPDGRTWLTTYPGFELPDPLTSCAGYASPTGAPIYLQLSNFPVEAPDVTASSLLDGATPLQHCVFDQTSYLNPDSGLQSLGRSILEARDAVVVLPRDPLILGHTYTVSVTEDGTTHTWSFTVVAPPP